MKKVEVRSQKLDGEISSLLDHVRARWRALVALRAFVRGGLIAAALVGIALVATNWTAGAPGALIALASFAVAAAAGALAWFLVPLRRAPAAKQNAPFVEERAPPPDHRPLTPGAAP